MTYYSDDELSLIGFRSYGERVRISRKASIYGAQYIDIGCNVRIDDFCVLSAGKSGIKIGSYIHLAVFSSLIGKERIELDDFSNISSRVSIYSSNDDYSGEWMTNPMVPVDFTRVFSAPVLIGKHVIIGSGSIILPGVKLETGVAIGALSLVKSSCAEFSIYIGIPARKIADRKRRLLEFEKMLINTKASK
jgi:acetyltransferase-like isoleucine patch superfamily enzyme